MTLNRLCGSGLQAIVSAAQMIQTGDADVALAGGAESMSRGAYWMENARWGARMGDASLVDSVVGALTDPFNNIHMGVTAENLAKSHGISREAQDEFALESHRRAIAAIEAGRFEEEVVPVEIRARKGTVEFTVDEHARPDVSLESLAKLRPAFDKAGTVTAGNASGVNDAGGRGGGHVSGPGAAARRAGQGQDPVVRGLRRGTEDDGHRAGTSGAQGARAGRQDARRGRRDRAQRGVRGPVSGGPEGSRPGHRAGQPERRRDRPRTSGRRYRARSSSPRSSTRWNARTTSSASSASASVAARESPCSSSATEVEAATAPTGWRRQDACAST